MFRGHSERNLDPKGRLMLPPEYREEVFRHSPEGKLMLTNFDGCVVGYTLPQWAVIEEGFRRVNVLNTTLRKIQRFIIAGAVEVELDKQGRILVPPYLRSYAKLDKDCILAGVVNKFEIWDKATFESMRKETEDNLHADLTSLADAGFELHL